MLLWLGVSLFEISEVVGRGEEEDSAAVAAEPTGASWRIGEHNASKSKGDVARDSSDDSVDDSDITENSDGLAGPSSFSVLSKSIELLFRKQKKDFIYQIVPFLIVNFHQLLYRHLFGPILFPIYWPIGPIYFWIYSLFSYFHT